MYVVSKRSSRSNSNAAECVVVYSHPYNYFSLSLYVWDGSLLRIDTGS